MLRKSALIGLVIAIGLAALYWSGAVSRDGSGIWPRLISSQPNYDALLADRAQQRQRPAPTRSQPAEAATPSASATSEGIRGRATVPREAGVPGGADLRDSPAPTADAPAFPPAFWPDFRGRNRDGRYDGTPIRTAWPDEGLPLLWKQPIGLGYASFVAAEGRAFTIEQRPEAEVVSAYDLDTGRELWTHRWEGEFVEYQGGDGPRATPTYDQGRIYALGALGELRSLDARTGGLIWRRNILEDHRAENLPWGMAASPLIVDEKVIVLPGGPSGRSVAAYDTATGDVLWTSLDDQQAYASPLVATLAGIRQLIIVSATRVVGLTIQDGRLLWDYPWANDLGMNAAQPLLVGNERVFVSSGYGHGAAVFEVARDGDRFSTRTVWRNTRMKNKFTSSVLHQGHVYGLDESILACVDVATGELKWKGGRYGYGQILLAGDHVIVLAEDGEVALVRATPDRHTELASFPAIEGRTWNHPIIAGGRLLVRNLREMAAFDIRP